MTTSYLPYDPQQQMLLPHALQDWLPEGHLAYYMRERLESRQRELDAAKGRSEDDERKPRDKDGKPRSGPRYKREFGVPEEKAQENFTDPDSRIMKCAGGGFDQCYNGHTAVDAHAQIPAAKSQAIPYLKSPSPLKMLCRANS